ncbi:MAG: ribonuclease H-like domain-containing protein [Bacteroidota bacterium]
MIRELNLENILFIDIETVPQYASYNEMSEPLKSLWVKKSEYLHRKEEETPESLYSRAGIYAEFGKVVCISVGSIKQSDRVKHLRIKSFYGEDEAEVLQQFNEMLFKFYNRPNYQLCAHNGKEFDFPYLSRRMLINRLRLPLLLNNAGKKPWEVNHLDTMDFWKFGDHKSFTSLELLAAVFGIPSPKEETDGSQVSRLYWEEKNMKQIVDYCHKDVATVVQIMMNFLGEPMIDESNIQFFS